MTSTLPQLVFLPGLANDAEVWADVRRALAARGGSLAGAAGRRWLDGATVADAHTRFDSLPQMAASLFAEHRGPLVLVGHSMGGMVAQQAAHLAPERVVGLVLIGTTARPDTPELVKLRSEACELFAAGRMDEVLRANVPFAFHPQHAADETLVARYFAMVRRAGAAQLIKQNRAVMSRSDSRPLLAAIDTRRCPTLVMCGEGDLLTPPPMAREIAAAMPGAQLEMLPGCGHMLLLEEPAAVAAVLGDWLAARLAAAHPG